jgi:hypothetical protein
MFIRTRLVHWLTFRFAAGITLFPFVLIAPGVPLSRRLLIHERIHLLQQAELLVLPFYLLYLLEYLAARFRNKTHYQAYRNISFEREAYSNDRNSFYLEQRKTWSWLKYL